MILVFFRQLICLRILVALQRYLDLHGLYQVESAYPRRKNQSLSIVRLKQ